METIANTEINPKLVFDIGTSEGNDTEFYLQKGFHVVSVEADPLTFQKYIERFAEPIKDGRLQAVNAAAARVSGERVPFFRNDAHQGLSSLKRSEKSRYSNSQTEFSAETVNWPSLIGIAGIPHYCKVDIEGAEAPFLASMQESGLSPEFISVEVKNFELVEMLHRMGYRRFKLVDQCILNSFEIPNPPLEGLYVPKPNWKHASGPFGRELPGSRWLDFQEISQAWEMTRKLHSYRTAAWTWYDCHAWAPLDTRP